MKHHWRAICAIVFVSMLATISVAPASADEYCISVNGMQIYDSDDNQNCFSGEGSQSIVVGDSYGGDIAGQNNTSIIVGDGNTGGTIVGSGNITTIVGNDNLAGTYFGADNTTTVIGDGNAAGTVFGENNDLTVIDDGGFYPLFGQFSCSIFVVNGEPFGGCPN